nr:MAG TPA_asm: hypothetical protein [Caudoviricetes sp.]
MRKTEAKDIFEIAFAVWANTVSTINLVVHLKGKKKTAPRKSSKRNRKR